MKTFIKAILTFLLTALIVFLAVIAFTFIGFWIGYLSGWCAKLVIGKYLIIAINTTFGSALTVDAIPWIAAALGWVGGFFKATIKTTKKEK